MSKFFQSLEALLFRHRVLIMWTGYAIAVLVLLQRYSAAFAPGGKPTYAYGDMLINYADGLARRGLTGEAAITLSQWLSGPPWVWAWALTAAAAGLFFLLAIRLVRRLSDDPKALPLVISLWGLMFFAYNIRSTFRKEIFGYLALALILQSAIANSRGAARAWAAAGTVTFVASVFAHEATVFLLPALMLAFLLAARRRPSDRMWFAFCAAASMLLGIAAFGILAMQPPRNAELICEAAQISCSSFRSQPFAWLARDAGDAIAYVIDRRSWIDLPIYAALALIAALPLLGFRIPGASRSWHWAAILIPAACMTPLFVIAIDWGRWIQMMVLPLSLVGIAALIAGLAQYSRLLPHWAAIGYSAIWSMSHIHTGYTPIALLLLSAFGIIAAVSWLRVRLASQGKVRSEP